MSAIIYLYATAPDRATAEALARALVEARLAACVNIMAEGLSIYRWAGETAAEPEVYMLVKTTVAQAAAARDLIVARHPYETPAVAAIRIDNDASSGPFLRWIAESCAAPEETKA